MPTSAGKDRRGTEADQRAVAQQAKDSAGDIVRLVLVRHHDDSETRGNRAEFIQCLPGRLKPGFLSIQVLRNSNTG